MKKFWVVVKDSGQELLPCSIRYCKEQEANEEAERLSANHGITFFVLELVGAVGPTSPPVSWTPIEKQS